MITQAWNPSLPDRLLVLQRRGNPDQLQSWKLPMHLKACCLNLNTIACHYYSNQSTIYTWGPKVQTLLVIPCFMVPLLFEMVTVSIAMHIGSRFSKRFGWRLDIMFPLRLKMKIFHHIHIVAFVCLYAVLSKYRSFCFTHETVRTKGSVPILTWESDPFKYI